MYKNAENLIMKDFRKISPGFVKAEFTYLEITELYAQIQTNRNTILSTLDIVSKNQNGSISLVNL
jgi:hypothetical protein